MRQGRGGKYLFRAIAEKAKSAQMMDVAEGSPKPDSYSWDKLLESDLRLEVCGHGNMRKDIQVLEPRQN